MRQIGIPAGGQFAGQQAVQKFFSFRLAFGPGIEPALPILVCRPAAVGERAGVGDDLVGDLKGLVRIEAEHLLGGGHLVGAQCRAVHPAGVHLGRRGVADDGPQGYERRFVGDFLGRLDRFFDTRDVLTALDHLNMPPVGLVAGRGVLGERDIGVVLDGDLIVIPEHDEIAQLLGAGQ